MYVVLNISKLPSVGKCVINKKYVSFGSRNLVDFSLGQNMSAIRKHKRKTCSLTHKNGETKKFIVAFTTRSVELTGSYDVCTFCCLNEMFLACTTVAQPRRSFGGTQFINA